MKDKLTSRKFWVCVAAMLASIAASIAGITTENQTILAVGTICGVASAAIYAFCEAWVDSKAAVPNYEDTMALVNEYLERREEEEEESE